MNNSASEPRGLPTAIGENGETIAWPPPANDSSHVLITGPSRKTSNAFVRPLVLDLTDLGDQVWVLGAASVGLAVLPGVERVACSPAQQASALVLFERVMNARYEELVSSDCEAKQPSLTLVIATLSDVVPSVGSAALFALAAVVGKGRAVRMRVVVLAAQASLPLLPAQMRENFRTRIAAGEARVLSSLWGLGATA